MNRCLKQIKRLSLSALIGLPLAACSTSPTVVQTGDRVDISFTCRLPGGELAATTRPDSSVTGETKAPVYLPRNGPDTVTVTAGPLSLVGRQSFEQEIVQRLAPTITGLKEGEQVQWEVEAERYPVSAPNDTHIVKLATVRKRQKEMRLSREEYSNKTGKSPEVGQPFVLDKLVPGQVSEVAEKEVVIRFAPVEAKDLVTPFGPVTVLEMADHYELEIAAKKGSLIRTGGMVGRISTVDNQSISIDYGHPFAGEKLNCEVTVVKVEPQKRDEASPPPRQAASEPAKVTLVSEPDPAIVRQLEEALSKSKIGK